MAELARRFLSFSARSARKRRSRGDSSRGGGILAPPVGKRGFRPPADDALVPFVAVADGNSVSEAGGDGCWLRPLAGRALGVPGEFVFVKKLGSGREDGAGEAWNVAPAKAETAAAAPVSLGPAVWGGVRRPDLAGGDVGLLLGWFLLLRLPALPEAACKAGAGLFEGTAFFWGFWGVVGPPSPPLLFFLLLRWAKSGWKLGSVLATSFSEA